MHECELCQHAGNGGDDVIYSNAAWRVVLADDAGFPGFCRVIWQSHVQEMTDLTAGQRQILMDVVWIVEQSIRDVMQPDKINLASLGNMVPHVHWHLIPRYRDDSHFPNPIWGQAQRTGDSAILMQRRALLPALRVAITARLASCLPDSTPDEAA